MKNIAPVLLYLTTFILCSLGDSVPTDTISNSPNLLNSSRILQVKDPNNITLTFGSCNSFWDKETGLIFNKIADLAPDVWTWVGDAAFADIRKFPPYFCGARADCVNRTFSIAKRIPTYARLRNSTQVIGTWNDHDYGKTRGGKSYEHKEYMQKVWLDYIDEPAESPRRTRSGVYESYYLDNAQKIKVILLDVRFSRDERNLFIFTNGTDMLGAEQWEWLENELKENQAEFVVIGSGSQVLPDDRIVAENWFSESRDRLVGLIRKYKVGGVVLISGGAQYAEVMKHPCKERVGFELYEFTSSGLTKSVMTGNFFADRAIPKMYPPTWNAREDMFFEKNFGVLNFIFGEEKGITFQIRDEPGNVVLEKFIPYSDLQFREEAINDTSSCVLDSDKITRFLGHYWNLLLNGEVFLYMALMGALGALGLIMLIIIVTIKGISASVKSLAGKLTRTPKVKSE